MRRQPWLLARPGPLWAADASLAKPQMACSPTPPALPRFGWQLASAARGARQ